MNARAHGSIQADRIDDDLFPFVDGVNAVRDWSQSYSVK